ncbi:MAG: DUF1997 domain-containing protein [Chroococcales cyanobacterium]
MQSQFIHEESLDLSQWSSEANISMTNLDTVVEQETEAVEATHFQTQFDGGMVMYANVEAVAEYLNAHEGWFRRCAKPMTAELLGENGYALTIGKFGSFGYEVEPKIGVVLSPPEENVYNMHTVPVPDYTPPGYDVDYRASMVIREVEPDRGEIKKAAKKSDIDDFEIPSTVTQVEWHLDLGVDIYFPTFIRKLPQSLIQSTGDRLLAQIVRQVSRRLTYKVQEDFHSRLGLPMPTKSSRMLS